MNTAQLQKLPRTFYQKKVLQIAPKLLGKYLVKKEGKQYLVGKIVEVEAYEDKVDEASHAFRGLTKRNKEMFGPAGRLYVYFIYGNHFCCNIVCDKEGIGSAILIRGLEPIDGVEVMAERRFNRTELTHKQFLNLSNGPGKICKALNISKIENGIDLCGEEIFLAEGEKVSPKNVVQSSRIGINKSTELLWRYFIKDNPFVSSK